MSSIVPRLTTSRLLLRPFDPVDAPAVTRLAGERAVAETTINIPHPYDLSDAEGWIASDGQTPDEQRFAITLRDNQALIGAIGLIITPRFLRAELGYWIGRPYWGAGYATEAGRAVLGYGFLSLGLHRIYADHFLRNPASGRVMQKLGMRYEGRAREHVCRDGRFEDVERYAILKQDWLPRGIAEAGRQPE